MNKIKQGFKNNHGLVLPNKNAMEIKIKKI